MVLVISSKLSLRLCQLLKSKENNLILLLAIFFLPQECSKFCHLSYNFTLKSQCLCRKQLKKTRQLDVFLIIVYKTSLQLNFRTFHFVCYVVITSPILVMIFSAEKIQQICRWQIYVNKENRKKERKQAESSCYIVHFHVFLTITRNIN